MMRNLIFFLFITASTMAFELTCRYHTDTDWWAINNVYFCDLKNDLDREILILNDVTSVNGDQLNGYSNADVMGFRANNRKLQIFPQGLNKFFDVNKIAFIAIWSTGLKEIHQNDLSPFTKMRILSLWDNNLEVIERDLFKFNPQIECIGLGKNKIKFVDIDVFDHLKNLHTLHIDRNQCISRQALDNKNEVLDVIKEIEEKCNIEPESEFNLDVRVLDFI